MDTEFARITNMTTMATLIACSAWKAVEAQSFRGSRSPIMDAFANTNLWGTPGGQGRRHLPHLLEEPHH